jgi:tetratricopeptide (TPR) repeat protein
MVIGASVLARPGSLRCATTMRAVRSPLLACFLAHLAAGPTSLCAAPLAHAAAFTPSNDAQVLERVPARASDPAARELQALRQAWRANPQDLPTALRLAERCFDEVSATGDPRHIGCTQAALQPWWALPSPPVAVRVLRAQVLQFDHQFDPALADLAAVLAQEPNHTRAWSWQLAIQMVRGDYRGARISCEALAALAPPLIGAACHAQLDATTGRAAAAAATLRQALAAPTADAAQRLWSLTRLAEIEERRGDWAAAEAAFREAQALGRPDVYLLAAHADFLLDRGRAAEVLALLKDRGRADVLLLRLALAARCWATPVRLATPPSWVRASTRRASAATAATARKNRATAWPCWPTRPRR